MSSEALKLFTFVVIVSGFPISVVHGDAYLDEWSGYCDAKKDLLSCAKYRALKYIANYTENSIVVNKMGPLRLMRVDDIDDGQSFFIESPRYFPGEGEFGKFLKFVQRQINYFLNHQGILISLPTGARIIEYNVDSKTELSPRSKKKKADLLIQLVTLFKVFKVKVLVALALVGIIIIKKILLAAAFILPSIIHNIKMNCKAAAMANAYHHYEDSHDDHQGFQGISGFGGGYGHSGYGNYAAEKSQLYQRRH